MPRIRCPPCECGHGAGFHENHAAPECIRCECPRYVDPNPFAEKVHELCREADLAKRKGPIGPVVIDANTGKRMFADDFFVNVNGEFFVCWLEVGLLHGTAYIRRNLNVVDESVETYRDSGMVMFSYRTSAKRPAKLGPVEQVPLVVRWTHPSFFGRRVAFFPS